MVRQEIPYTDGGPTPYTDGGPTPHPLSMIDVVAKERHIVSTNTEKKN